MIRLRKPLQYYREKYGSCLYALNKLYLLMEKQHNRGQEAAGVGVVKMHSVAGHEYIFRERAQGADAISKIFASIHQEQKEFLKNASIEDIDSYAPFVGQIYMGHLRYSTTGRSGLSFVHPFLRRNNWRSRNLLLCGNFNMTNVSEIFNEIVATGQHPKMYSDTIALLEQLGYALDKENHRVYREFRDKLSGAELSFAVEDNIRMENVLLQTSPQWDGGFVICGATGSGDMFALRDSHGIRPAFYYVDDEVIVLASERPVIQTVFDVKRKDVNELQPGEALIVNKAGDMRISQVLPYKSNSRCSFERIYFSRGSDADIYKERKALGAYLVPDILKAVDGDLDHAVFSFIPNTAEVAFNGMVEELQKVVDKRKTDAILDLSRRGELNPESLRNIMDRKLRIEKIAIKDIKLRTFIAETDNRNDLATHVYDVTYGCIENQVDSLVVIDDSIVRGTTLKKSIVRILDRLNPKRIVIVSSSPQVRYPDCYGIDMSSMDEFIAFRAAVDLLRERGMWEVIDETYRACLEELEKPADKQVNKVKAIYRHFTDDEITNRIAEMIVDDNTRAEVKVVYQTMEGLRTAIPNHPGDWYFTGDYPTPGGIRFVNRSFVNYYEGNSNR